VHGVCTPAAGVGRCECNPSFTGTSCDQCLFGGTCVHGSCDGTGACICDPGWQGNTCEVLSSSVTPSCSQESCTSPGNSLAYPSFRLAPRAAWQEFAPDVLKMYEMMTVTMADGDLVVFGQFNATRFDWRTGHKLQSILFWPQLAEAHNLSGPPGGQMSFQVVNAFVSPLDRIIGVLNIEDYRQRDQGQPDTWKTVVVLIDFATSLITAGVLPGITGTQQCFISADSATLVASDEFDSAKRMYGFNLSDFKLLWSLANISFPSSAPNDTVSVWVPDLQDPTGNQLTWALIDMLTGTTVRRSEGGRLQGRNYWGALTALAYVDGTPCAAVSTTTGTQGLNVGNNSLVRCVWSYATTCAGGASSCQIIDMRLGQLTGHPVVVVIRKALVEVLWLNNGTAACVSAQESCCYDNFVASYVFTNIVIRTFSSGRVVANDLRSCDILWSVTRMAYTLDAWNGQDVSPAVAQSGRILYFANQYLLSAWTVGEYNAQGCLCNLRAYVELCFFFSKINHVPDICRRCLFCRKNVTLVAYTASAI